MLESFQQRGLSDENLKRLVLLVPRGIFWSNSAVRAVWYLNGAVGCENEEGLTGAGRSASVTVASDGVMARTEDWVFLSLFRDSVMWCKELTPGLFCQSIWGSSVTL